MMQLMETQPEAMRQQAESDDQRATGDDGAAARGAILLRIIKDEVIPGLACKTKNTERRSSAEKAAKALVAAGQPLAHQQQIELLTALALNTSEAPIRDHVAALMAAGLTHGELFSDLLANVARRLGTMWEDDACSFIDVTIGVGRLHDIVHALSPSAADQAGTGTSPRPSLYLLPAPGEQHIFGLLVLSEHFRASGWRVEVGHKADDVDVAFGLIRQNNCDCIGVTISAERCIAPLTQLLSSLRNSQASSKPVLIGGAACQRDPNLAERVGADGSATNETEAVTVACSLLIARAEQPIA